MSAPLPVDLACYGPLAGLIGSWTGDKGTDVAPDPDGTEENPYYETLRFEGIGPVDNAEDQHLYAVFYHLRVNRKGDHKLIHHQTGYWMWDAREKLVMVSLNIPRGLCVLAGSKFEGDPNSPLEIQVSAGLDDPDWSLVQSPFLRDNARTLEFSHTLRLDGDELSYNQTTLVDIYGERFEHTDRNRLSRE